MLLMFPWSSNTSDSHSTLKLHNNSKNKQKMQDFSLFLSLLPQGWLFVSPPPITTTTFLLPTSFRSNNETFYWSSAAFFQLVYFMTVSCAFAWGTVIARADIPDGPRFRTTQQSTAQQYERRHLKVCLRRQAVPGRGVFFYDSDLHILITEMAVYTKQIKTMEDRREAYNIFRSMRGTGSHGWGCARHSIFTIWQGRPL